MIEKTKIDIKKVSEKCMIEANNLKINIFPETIREVNRCLGMLN